MALTIYDVVFFAFHHHNKPAIWLINPFPVATTIFAIVNFPLIVISVNRIGKHLPLSSVTRNTIQRCCPCSCSTQFHLFILLYSLTNLVVFVSFHFQWFIMGFLSYPVQALCSLMYLIPVVLILSLLPLIFDVLLSAKNCKKRALRSAVFGAFILIFVMVVVLLYMLGSIMLLYAYTAPAWSGIVALIGTGATALFLYLFKLASGDSKSSEATIKALSLLAAAELAKETNKEQVSATNTSEVSTPLSPMKAKPDNDTPMKGSAPDGVSIDETVI